MIDELIDKLYELYDRLFDKVGKIHETNCQKVRRAIASIIEKTYLGNYMINMEMYEVKHGVQDLPSKVRK